MDTPLLITRPPTDDIELFHLFASVKAAVSIGHCMCPTCQLLGNILEMALLSQRTYLFVILTETAQMPSLKALLIDIPTRNAANAYFLTTFPKKCVIKLWKFCPSDSKK